MTRLSAVRSRRIGVALGLLAVTLAGCTSSEAEPLAGQAVSGGTVAGHPTDPVGLINNWLVSDNTAVEGTVLTFAEDGFHVAGPCGQYEGSWWADPSGMFLASSPDTGITDIAIYRPENCPGGGPTWLLAAESFRVSGEVAELLDDDGTMVATLHQGGRPGATSEFTKKVRKPAPLPAGLVPAERDRLLGRWRADAPTGLADTPIRFHADRTWQGSDGCNFDAGTWTLGPDGGLLMLVGQTTNKKCPGPTWQLTTVRKAALDGEQLVLLDADGKEVGRLSRR